MRATGRKLYALSGAILAGLLVTSARGQAGPDDLTIPPELRGAQPAGADASSPHPHQTTARVSRTRDPQSQGHAKHRPDASHPVDFGVVVRGGSATPHIISPLGSSQAVQESGSAVGAGMRFGF